MYRMTNCTTLPSCAFLRYSTAFTLVLLLAAALWRATPPDKVWFFNNDVASIGSFEIPGGCPDVYMELVAMTSCMLDFSEIAFTWVTAAVDVLGQQNLQHINRDLKYFRCEHC